MPRCFLFAGLGSIGQRHLRNLLAVLPERPRLLAYRGRGGGPVLAENMDVVEGVGLEEYYGLESFTELDAALAHRPQAVFVTNPTHLRLPVALAAAKAGCHLFLEKPLADRREGVDELIAEVETRRLVAHVGFQMRFHPALDLIRTWMADGLLGRILSARFEVGEYLPGFHPWEDYRRSYASRRDLGGGAALSMIHEIDMIAQLFGRPTKVYSVGGHLSSLEIDVDDTVESILTLTDADGRAFPVSLHQDFTCRPARRRLHVMGEAGTVDWDVISGRLVRHRDGQAAESHDFSGLARNRLFLDQIKHFLDCIDTGASPRCSLRQAAVSLDVALAELASLASGFPVSPS